MEQTPHSISWNELDIAPSIQIKEGVLRRLVPLNRHETTHRGILRYSNELAELDGQWSNISEIGSVLKFRLTNISEDSIRIARLIFPTESGLDTFISDFDPQAVSFLRNGYQSWSTSRSYRMSEKPLRPYLQIVSLASSNLANLPSNIPGILSSDMYSCITDKRKRESFFIGQGPPFNQFFYIRLNVRRREGAKSYFEIVFDFGRKLLRSQESIELDAVYMMKAETEGLLHNYFPLIGKKMGIRLPEKHIRGWCSWYYYFNRITPDDILKNVEVVRQKKLPLDMIQIDDGYQQNIGDWLTLKPEFKGKMKMTADAIREAGYIPGIWLAPFIADRKSHLVKIHPDYILRNEHGGKLLAGLNVAWPGKFYYGLDITNPRFEEYIRKVIRVIVHTWGYTFLKCDFLFGGCLRGGSHKELTLSRAEVLKRGMNIIREEAGDETLILGCGMPLSPGIGTVDLMRIGPDTGPFWIHRSMKLLRTGSMVGVRGSIRNVFVRSAMQRNLWINDPDCLMLRRSRTKLNETERMFQINAIILSGGPLLISDDLSKLAEADFEELIKIEELSTACSTGRQIIPDLMDSEIPRQCYNTAGYLGVFNPSERKRTITIDVFHFRSSDRDAHARDPLQSDHHFNYLVDVWTGETFSIPTSGRLSFENLPKHSSRLFKVQ